MPDDHPPLTERRFRCVRCGIVWQEDDLQQIQPDGRNACPHEKCGVDSLEAMPDDHPPFVAVAAAFRDEFGDWDPEGKAALAALRALNTVPVRTWAQEVPCRERGLEWPCRADRDFVHPECLLAALAVAAS